MLQCLHLTEDEDFVSCLAQAPEHALHELHLATLSTDLLCRRIGDAAIKGALDEVWVVAVLAHLHQDIVQLGHADMCPTLGPRHGFHCLLHQHHSKNEKVCHLLDKGTYNTHGEDLWHAQELNKLSAVGRQDSDFASQDKPVALSTLISWRNMDCNEGAVV